MYKVLRPVKDAYITNRVINASRQTSANVGSAGSLDLYKLYGFTSSGSVPNVELTRLLVKFDVNPLREAIATGDVDVGNPSFKCHLRLHDVYGGQPTPRGFVVDVFPLSASFDEGLGRDVVFYSDNDTCNWLTGSLASGAWFVTGCGLPGDDRAACDYLTGTLGASTHVTQSFVTGEEDLDVDVTSIVSGVISGLIPDEGFRISLAAEADDRTYFVKRFASRTAFNDDLHPKLAFGFDDSIQDDVNDMYLDARGYVFLRNYERSTAANLVSGSNEITGRDCLVLRLETPVSGGSLSLYFTGSQHYSGIHAKTGIYSASVLVSASVPSLVAQWMASGSVTFTPVWTSLDGTLAYHTGSSITFAQPQRGSTSLAPRRLSVNVSGLKQTMGRDESSIVRIHIFDTTSPHLLRASRLPVERPGATFRDVHWRVRDAVTDLVVIPFDAVNNSTRASNDDLGMYFKLDASSLTNGRTYVIDVMVTTGDDEQVYQSASPSFRVVGTA